MNELFCFVEAPRRCSYLPNESASLEIRGIAGLSAAEYANLLARGYRRFGWQVFRPSCRDCAACRSLRVVVRDFKPGRSERRILRQNAAIRAELHPLFVTSEIVELYNRYHRFMQERRGWPRQQCTAESYRDSFLSGAANHGRQWLYFDNGRLVGVALMDQVPGAISLVYCFYHPDWRNRSPGTFSILNQLLYARAENLEHAYLGYWIEACPSMSYKRRFQPHEILREYSRDDVEPIWEIGPACEPSR